MYLPNEIILLILRSLEKHDLKSARLVSKTWTFLAAEFLIDQVYGSVHPENLEVFNAIARHPLLSQCIKTLRYDAVEFVEAYKKEQYFWVLWKQVRRYFRDSGLRQFDESASCPDVNSFVKLATCCDDILFAQNVRRYYKTVWETCEGHDFITYGYQKYQKCAALQCAQFNNGSYLDSLVGGLQTLKNLSCIMLDGQWSFPPEVLHDPNKLVPKRPTGSPLARDWNIFHACPQAWDFVPLQFNQESTLIRVAANGEGHYWTIIAALLRSQRKIQTFKTGDQSFCSFPSSVFDRTRKESLSLYGLDIAAFSELQVLKLSIHYTRGNSPDPFPNIDGLQFLLRSMHHLRVLDLDFPGWVEDKPAFYKSSQVFPQEGQWSQLTSLSLYSISSSAAEFLTLITRRMPALNCLQLGTIELDTGDWKGVIECMKYSMHLSRFDIIPFTQFYHHGAIGFFNSEMRIPNLVPKPDEIKTYVESGGRHPCLRPDQSDSAAMLYVTSDIQDFYIPISTHTLPEL